MQFVRFPDFPVIDLNKMRTPSPIEAFSMRKSLLTKLVSFSVLNFFVMTCTATSSVDDAARQARLKKFEQFVSTHMAREKIPGLSIGYIQDKLMWTRGYGYADVENKITANADSSYRLASVTKPMTATAILQLVDQGKIDLDAEVQTYVPYFPKKPFPITVRQLLGHMAGINAYVNPQLEQHFKDHKNTRESIAVFENFDLIAKPGSRFRYTSYGYNLLGAVIEGASGMSYGDYMTKHIWAPLGMRSTRLDSPYDMIPRRVRGYQLLNNQIKHSEFIDISSRFSAGGTRSSVVDMLKFGDAINRGGLLSKASQQLIFDSMTTTNGELTQYSAGWITQPINGRFSISHDGVQPETSTYLFNFPSRHLTIAVATNLQRFNTSVFVEQLFEAVTGEAWDVPLYLQDPKKRPYYEVMQNIFNEGRAYFEREGKSYSDDVNNGAANKENTVAKLNAAFDLVNQKLILKNANGDINLVQESLRLAKHPAGDLHLRRLGSYIAEQLHQSGHSLSVYSNSGVIAFIHDYIRLYKKDPTIPSAFHFDTNFETTVNSLYESWSKTSKFKLSKHDFQLVDYVKDSNKRNARKTQDPAIAVNALIKKIKQAFLNVEVVPNYLPELKTLVQDLMQNGQLAYALQIGELAQSIYPLSDASHAMVGVTEILMGNKDKGISSFKRALALNAKGEASAQNLNNTAYQLKNVLGTKVAIEILLGAIELHPDDVNLHDSLGEFYAEIGSQNEAVLAYQKALSLNPQYPNSAVAKATIIELGKLP